MRSVRAYDAAIVTWAVLWAVIGLLVWDSVRGLGELSDTVVTSARALDQTEDALAQIEDTVEGLPFVGEIADLEKLRKSVRQTAREARASGRSSREDIRRLALLLGISVAVAPTLPAIALYLPLRRLWRRSPLPS